MNNFASFEILHLSTTAMAGLANSNDVIHLGERWNSREHLIGKLFLRKVLLHWMSITLSLNPSATNWKVIKFKFYEFDLIELSHENGLQWNVISEWFAFTSVSFRSILVGNLFGMDLPFNPVCVRPQPVPSKIDAAKYDLSGLFFASVKLTYLALFCLFRYSAGFLWRQVSCSIWISGVTVTPGPVTSCVRACVSVSVFRVFGVIETATQIHKSCWISVNLFAMKTSSVTEWVCMRKMWFFRHKFM